MITTLANNYFLNQASRASAVPSCRAMPSKIANYIFYKSELLVVYLVSLFFLCQGSSASTCSCAGKILNFAA
jgi:hypothetical protein